jgi:hypothetical protein
MRVVAPDFMLPPIADLYFPNNARGRAEARRMLREIDIKTVGFCSDYRKTPYWGRWKGADEHTCDHRDHRDKGGLNRCHRCPAGYLFTALHGRLVEDNCSPCVL